MAKHMFRRRSPWIYPAPPSIPLDNGIGGGILTCPQRSRCPPAWLKDFVVGGEIDQSLTGSQDNHKQLSRINIMAQCQLEQPSLNIQDMWHRSDDEERREKRLPGEGLNISWVAAATKQQVTDRSYKAIASEGKFTEAACGYSTLSRKKLLDVIYMTDCNYMTSRRDSAVKYLRACHERRGSITQAERDSWNNRH